MHLIGIFAGPGEAAEAVLQHHRENVRITVIANNDAAIREVGREAGKGVNGICLHTDVNLMDELKALVKRETYPEKYWKRSLNSEFRLKLPPGMSVRGKRKNRRIGKRIIFPCGQKRSSPAKCRP
ncbi:MAG: hypothetical protein SOI31_09680 [Heyndrickxia coagulans]|jgi:hypothetical protein